MRKLFVLFWAMMGLVPVFGQRGIGLRFASDFNYFSNAQEYKTIDGWFSCARFGPYYQAIFKQGGFRTGVYILHKPGGSSGFPVVMHDFRDGQRTGYTALEYDLRVGPRFWFLTPSIGMIMGYRITATGMLEPNTTQHINRFYLNFPIGCSFDWPTGYGSVGFGAYWNIGLTNADSDPTPNDGNPWDGSKQRAVCIEITNVFAAGKQERKRKPPKPEEFKVE